MSLLLRGTPTIVCYSQDLESSTTSGSAMSVVVVFRPATAVAGPIDLIVEGVNKSTPAGYRLRQLNNTTCELSWLTSAGTFSHQFTTVGGEQYKTVVVFDKTAQTISFYVDSTNPVSVSTNVGTPTRTTMKLHVKTSPVLGEEWTLSDLAMWATGKPNTLALNTLFSNQFTGAVFKASGASDKYIFLGGDVATELTYTNSYKITNRLMLTTPPGPSDPESVSGIYDIPDAAGHIETQIGSQGLAYWSGTDTMIDRYNCTLPIIKPGNGVGDIYAGEYSQIPPGWHDKETDIWTIPDDFDMTGYPADAVVFSFGRIGQNQLNNPAYYNGTWVFKWTGTMEFQVFSAQNIVYINDHHIEFSGCTSGTYIGMRATANGGDINGLWCTEVKIYPKQHEAIYNDGRLFNPQFIDYYSRYTTIRMMDIANTNGTRHTKLSDTTPYGKFLSDACLDLDSQVRLVMEADTEMWFCIPPYLGTDEAFMPTSGNALEWQAFGAHTFETGLNMANVEEYVGALVDSLNARGYPLDRKFTIEFGNEIWNFGQAFNRTHNFSYGIRVAAGSFAGPPFGAGWLGYQIINAFAKALYEKGRASQVWLPIAGCQTVWANQALGYVIGATLAESQTPEIERYFNVSDYKIATTSYTTAIGTWDTEEMMLGETFPTKYDFYDRWRDLAINDETELRRWIHKAQVASACDNYNLHIPDHFALLAPYNVTGPVYEYEGTSHNTPYDVPEFSRIGGMGVTPLIGMTRSNVVFANVVTNSAQSIYHTATGVPIISTNVHRIYYPPTSGGVTITPILASGNPTGQFSVSGDVVFDLYVLDAVLCRFAKVTMTYVANSLTSKVIAAWVDDGIPAQSISRYNKSQHGAVVAKISIEMAASSNVVASTTNFGLLGPDYGNLGAWHEAEGWSTINTDIRALVWVPYISEPRDASQIWSDYQDFLVDYTPPVSSFQQIAINESLIRSTYEVVPMSVARSVRSSGSIFATRAFNDIDFEGAEFFYLSESNGITYTPVMDTGIFTGYMDMSGQSTAIVTMYMHDVVNDDWYEFDVSTSGSIINFTVNNLIGIETGAAGYITGDIFGTPGTIITGTDIQFSNDNGASWSASKTLVPNQTKYRKAVVGNAQPARIDSFEVSITDGTVSYIENANVITRPATPPEFSTEEEDITFQESATGTIALFEPVREGTGVFTLTGVDAGIFSINSFTGAISVATVQNYEDPDDANQDGVYNFTVVYTEDSGEASLDVNATITDVAEHDFSAVVMPNVNNIIPGASATSTVALTGGIVGQPFAVVGMTSSNDGGVTYNASSKNYVAGQTYVRLTAVASSQYNTAVVANGTVTWSSGTESKPLSATFTTKAGLVPVVLPLEIRINHPAGSVISAADLTPTGGDGTFSYAITGGADAALFTINASSGVISWVSAPTYDSSAPIDNNYIVEVTVSNTDTVKTASVITNVIFTVIPAASGLEAESGVGALIALSNGTWTTNQNYGLVASNNANGTGSPNVMAYHDVVRFVKHPKTRTVNILSVNSVTNGTATPAFSNTYLSVTPSSAADMSVSLTVEDDLGNEATFTYLVDVE